MKKCSKCKKQLGLEKFSICHTNKDGLQYKCKDCVSKHHYEYRLKHLDLLTQRSRLSHKRNKDNEKIQNKKYYLKHQKYYKLLRKKNHKQHQEYDKKYYMINANKIKLRQKKYNIENIEKIKTYYTKNIYKIKERVRKYRDSLQGRDCYTNKKFGVSISDMLEWQDYKCAICRVKENGKKLEVDHCHKKGWIRMLLCNRCNSGLGITDNAELLFAKSQYIKVYNALDI